MDVMYFKGREKKSERLAVRALHYITLHYITLHYITLHYISKACLENFAVKFNRTIQNALHFESLFFYKGVIL